MRANIPQSPNIADVIHLRSFDACGRLKAGLGLGLVFKWIGPQPAPMLDGTERCIEIILADRIGAMHLERGQYYNRSRVWSYIKMDVLVKYPLTYPVICLI